MTRTVGAGTLRPITDPAEQEAVAALGALLAHARRTARLTQRQLALAAGVTERFVQYLEAGERRTCPSTLARITDILARRLECDPGELFDLFIETAGVGLAPESEHDENKERRREARQRRVWVAELMADFDGRNSLHRTVRRWSLPEDRRRAARLTLRAMRENAGLPGV